MGQQTSSEIRERQRDGYGLRPPGLALLLLMLGACGSAPAETPTANTVTAFDSYTGSVEARLGNEHRSKDGFIVLPNSDAGSEARLRQGELIVEKLTPRTGADIPGAMLHDWRGTAFAPGATGADFERLMKNFDTYPQRFAPEVIQAKTLTQQGNHFEATMRVRQRHVITVVMDTTYAIDFGRLDAGHGYSSSRSTRIAEIGSAGTTNEHTLGPNEDHGFLWRLNTYWSYEERDGGLYMQIESVSLTRSIPTGLGWAIGPFVESVPRESLEFTLRAACNALRR